MSSSNLPKGGDPAGEWLTEAVVRRAYEHFLHDAEAPCSASAMREAILLAIASVPRELPPVLDGHWNTPAGLEIVREYATKTRADLSYGDRSDFGLANAQYLVSRDSLDLLPMQTAAKERIRWLSVQLALARLGPPPQPDVDGLVSALQSISEYWNRDQNHDAMVDACWHAINTAAEALSNYQASQAGEGSGESRDLSPSVTAVTSGQSPTGER